MRKLERTYSGTERIIARARFSAWAFLREAFIAALLGGIIAVLWIFADDIEGALDPNFSGAARYLTPTNLKWAMVGAGGFVVLLTLLHALSIYMQEIIVTEDKFLFRSGVGSTVNVMLPLNEIRYIDVRQNALQHRRGGTLRHPQPRPSRALREKDHAPVQLRPRRRRHPPATRSERKTPLNLSPVITPPRKRRFFCPSSLLRARGGIHPPRLPFRRRQDPSARWRGTSSRATGTQSRLRRVIRRLRRVIRPKCAKKRRGCLPRRGFL